MSEYQFKDVAHVKAIFQNGGLDPLSGERMEMKDILNTSNAGPMLPKTMVSIVKEAQEPLLIGTSLLDRLEYQYGQTIVFPAVGAMVADDIAEGQEYPEVQPNLGGATVTANVGKSGIAFGFTEEMLRYSQFDLMGLYMRGAAKALARHKEKKIFDHVLSMGVVCFDNADPSGSIFGVTTGRDLNGAANGSVILDDLFDVIAQMMHNGFMPDSILIHPLAWLMWVKDPIMRDFAINAGGGPFFQRWQGEVAKQFGPQNGPQGKLGLSGGAATIPGNTQSGETATSIEGYNQTMTGRPNIPPYFPFPFRILVSPFMPFDPATLLTDIIVFQSGELGALLVDEDLYVEEWNDPRVDIKKVKMRERYALGIYNEGLGVGLIKNVKVVPNQIVLPASATISVSGGVDVIPAGTAVV